ncbi:hypothetical protein [Amycolatopsis methanolica]|uniref:hypothetical protein n=1 Tax=Amycolatopsis methanolica TaxID=1814 RepID=UPI00342F78D3
MRQSHHRRAVEVQLGEAARQQKARGIHVMALCPGVTAPGAQQAGDVPAWLVQTPEEVAREALTALAARKGPVVVSGRGNSVLTSVARLLPRSAVLSVLAR